MEFHFRVLPFSVGGKRVRITEDFVLKKILRIAHSYDSPGISKDTYEVKGSSLLMD